MSKDPQPVGLEQTFFADPSMDRLMGVVFRLAAELHVTRDRLQALEQVLEGRGQIRTGEVDDARPEGARGDAARRERQEYVSYVLGPVLGESASKSG